VSRAERTKAKKRVVSKTINMGKRERKRKIFKEHN
jgi:hypothetical protein